MCLSKYWDLISRKCEKNVMTKKKKNEKFELIMTAMRLSVYSCCGKNDIFLFANLTARGLYVSFLQQARDQSFKIFCPVK